MDVTARIYEFPTPSEREGRPYRARRSPLRDSAASRKCRRSVSNKALDWAWTQPVRGTRQHVLLALAKKARPKSELATPSMPELIEMTGLSENTIRGHIQALTKLGIIRAEVSDGGRHKRSRYTLLVGSAPASPSETPQQLRGIQGGETPQEMDRSEPETPQELRRNPAGAAPVVLRTKSGTRGVREATAVADAASQTAGDGLFEEPVTPASTDRARVKVAQAIAARYCELEPMSKYVNVLGIVRRPLETGRFSGEMVMAAVERLAKQERPLTLETLRIELVGLPPRASGSQRSPRVPLRERLMNGGAA